MRKHFFIWMIISVITTLAYLIITPYIGSESIYALLGTITAPLAVTLFVPLLLSFIIMTILRKFKKISPSKIF
jgi:uncharacterized membrane protein YhaH (DUF805 family)